MILPYICCIHFAAPCANALYGTTMLLTIHVCLPICTFYYTIKCMNIALLLGYICKDEFKMCNNGF